MEKEKTDSQEDNPVEINDLELKCELELSQLFDLDEYEERNFDRE